MRKFRLISWLPTTILLFAGSYAGAQSQTCPVNINFAAGNISSWSAETGLLNGSSQSYPAPNQGITVIPEFSINTTGIQVITTPSNDLYGGFTTIPVINGYDYKYSVKLGSTATSWDLQSQGNNNPGGFRRSITYLIEVPAGPATVPYTMTYAYAMVLENGTHNSNRQPLFKATLSTRDGVIDCASPEYYLPTFNDAGGSGGGSTGATLDSATALANGFQPSPIPFFSHAGPRGNEGTYLKDVWTKGWREVTFDLSPYRGQTVTLSFEADNCVPGAHFAYAYVALRSDCGGLMISGNPEPCTGTPLTYSVPALANATYKWTVPAGWKIDSGATTNTIRVTPGINGGIISVHEVNSCADLRDNLAVTTKPPTVAGSVAGDARICAGANSVPLTLQGSQGNILGWISSTDGVHWSPLGNTTATGHYTVQDLDTTTRFTTLVQNGSTCSIDTSQAALITVDARSAGGVLSPASSSVCVGQNVSSLITLSGQTGGVLNWQWSDDSIHWEDFSPVDRATSYDVRDITKTTYYRTLVKSGVCPEDTSIPAVTRFVHVPFPRAVGEPLSALICYGDSIRLDADISTGTDYAWSPLNTLSGRGSGTLSMLPAGISIMAKPTDTTNYVLTLKNAGCPNALMDTFHISVTPPILVFAGNDTSIVAGQPLQLNATVDDPDANLLTWTPATGLNFTNIKNPVASLGSMTDSITYLLRAENAAGCYGADSLTVAVFKTGTNLFVPTAFTPNGDGMNDRLYPICVGIKRLVFFRVYDRWGKLVFATNQIGSGWDGRVQGKEQATGGFVYLAEGIDYTGKAIFSKGSVLLIR